tara:strand:+ start:3041 stop:3643 length:603 start_codon:yes stop_codon:yes gene_type:complete
MEIIKRVTLDNGTTIEMWQDCSPESPRDWSNVAQMIFVGDRVSLGDKHDVVFGDNYYGRQHFIEKGEMMVRGQIKDVVICKPVHMYIHSGTSISTSYVYPYNCKWDSGTCGFAIVTKQSIRETWNIKRVTQKYIDMADEALESEIKILNQYIGGEVYGFTVEGGGEGDSCGGFFGDDPLTNGMSDYMGEEYAKELSEASF